jgi:uncharacterized protein (TIGR02145 family)
MRKIENFLTRPLVLVLFLLMLTDSCKKKPDEIDNSDNINFNTLITYGSLTDQDGNIYKTVTIGTQVWMAENLKTTKYRNGEAIPNVTDNTEWENLTTGAYCNYDNDSKRINTYGQLYNWYAVSDNRNIAPTGWHVATDAEWTTLYNYLGGGSAAGDKLKETGTIHWYITNSEATNESGFTALPGGFRNNMTIFGLQVIYHYSDIGSDGYWWASTESESTAAPIRFFAFDNSLIRNLFLKHYGCSVRCIRD